jgi:isoleucyl-tRNA synthetase
MAVYPRSQDASAANDGGVPTQPSFPSLEADVLKDWQANDTFRATIARREDAPEFVFYDGPPFANGLPHYGHLLTGYVKDVVPRYKTMRGFRVDRRFGWDCHGLPAEVEAERQLGISGKADIITMGIDKFNAACRESVLRYTSEWQDYVSRQARWVDFDNDYKTLNLDYMESVMWAFKQLHDKGLVYQGFKVLPYCWRCETPLSNHELRMDDDVYQERQDPSVTVRFRLETGEWLLAWTTTPWTLPSNLAVAVGADIRYAVVELDYERYILAEDRLSRYQNELGDATRVDTVTGASLAGRRYEPLFPYLADTPNAFRVILSPDVTTEDGTGVVHMAPAYGEADAEACAAAGIPVVLTVDDQARFTSLVPDFEGQHVFDANKPITAALRASGALVRAETYAHSYPHCWRCRNPLIYKAMSSWFVEVTKFRDRMVELNDQITWVPSHIKDGQFGKWLSNARDWSISRNRFWGSPIPVWMSDDPAYPRVDVYGSLDELERDFGVRPADLHRPHIDSLTRVNPDDPTGQSVMRRVPEVLDCWFESGSMPFAQVHYPFENREWFDSHYPGDFIVEYIGQTRGWFYLLHVLATALFDRPAFRTCLSHGIVLGDDGQKMSKSLRNYPDVNEVFDSYGSDAMRWFLMSSPVLRGGNMIVTEQGIRDAVRQAILPLWNSYYFFALYANAESYTARFSQSSDHVLDRYILAKTRSLVTSVGAELDEYDIAAGCQALRDHLELLTNWYIRRSRSRFWQGDTDALDTLYTVLETTCRVAAPLLPLTTEAVWRGLTGDQSVHLASWPEVSAWPSDPELADAMDLVRLVCSSALGLRKARQLRVRLPLASLTVAHPGASGLAPFTDIIRDELNVKDVLLNADPASLGTFELAVNPRVLGPRLGGKVQDVIRAVKAGDWTSGPDDVVTAAGVELQPGEYELRLSVADAAGATAALPGGVGLVALDTVLTPSLEAEGTARDVVRAVQQARRDAGLDVSDRISVVIGADAATLRAVSAHADFVKAETLAVDLELTQAGSLSVSVTPKSLRFS